MRFSAILLLAIVVFVVVVLHDPGTGEAEEAGDGSQAPGVEVGERGRE